MGGVFDDETFYMDQFRAREGWADTCKARRFLLGGQPSPRWRREQEDLCGCLGSLPEHQIKLAVRAYENADRESENRSVAV